MEVILREHVDNLGHRGEIVKVAAGYARNYLLPRKLALLATEGNKKHVERERKIMEAREAEEKGQAEAMASRLALIEISIARRVGETDQLYGSVTAVDIADYLKSKGFEIDRRKLILPEPIKAIGEHNVPLKLHREVTVPLVVQGRQGRRAGVDAARITTAVVPRPRSRGRGRRLISALPSPPIAQPTTASCGGRWPPLPLLSSLLSDHAAPGTAPGAVRPLTPRPSRNPSPLLSPDGR